MSTTGGATNLFSRNAENEGERAARHDFVEREEQGMDMGVSFGGPSPGYLDARLLPFDRDQAAREPVPFGASINRRLQVTEGYDLLLGLMQRLGIDTKTEGVQMAFVNAMLLAHAKNSASVLVPDRAVFFVGLGSGRAEYNFFSDVIDILSSDARRFFRTYANYERAVLEKLLAQRASTDPDIVQDIADIDWVASDRGMSREPHLCFDSAEACSGLTAFQRSLISNSKASVLANIYNKVDVALPARYLEAKSRVGVVDDGNKGISGVAGGPGY